MNSELIFRRPRETRIRQDSGATVRNRVRAKLGFESQEMLHRKSCQESFFFSKREQILLVEGINVGFGILFDDPFGKDDGTTFVCSTNVVKGNNLASK